ncbi:hypothetical protein [Marinimicrobium sp. ABcell2]|uniref:hypothetical protein n=1 Tax=Marinimicrobium sp. ABcell2 TaxID=3069751 RepID=UPI0027AE2575|nr:hypothetical protein [Marinimicrobium sp. ABcell2]MDQ2076327.1 hypothetical protein [Marinimicrobium sp. ABcell2]
MRRFIGVVALMGALSGCQTTDLDPVPGLIVEPDADSRAALSEAVSNALDGVDVLLAPNALTESSVLILEQSHYRADENMHRQGRRLDQPEHFQLLFQGGACILVHKDSGQHQMLADTECKPE